MTTLADFVERGFTTGLVQALVALWPGRGFAAEYTQRKLEPAIKRMGWLSIGATLDLPGHSPTDAFLASVTNRKRVPGSGDIYSTLDGAFERRIKNAVGVLILDAVERWASQEWQSDVSAYRSWIQAQQGKLCVVYNFADRAAADFLFQQYSQPLYGQGMRLKLDARGNVL